MDLLSQAVQTCLHGVERLEDTISIFLIVAVPGLVALVPAGDTGVVLVILVLVSGPSDDVHVLVIIHDASGNQGLLSDVSQADQLLVVIVQQDQMPAVGQLRLLVLVLDDDEECLVVLQLPVLPQGHLQLDKSPFGVLLLHQFHHVLARLGVGLVHTVVQIILDRLSRHVQRTGDAADGASFIERVQLLLCRIQGVGPAQGSQPVQLQQGVRAQQGLPLNVLQRVVQLIRQNLERVLHRELLEVLHRHGLVLLKN